MFGNEGCKRTAGLHTKKAGTLSPPFLIYLKDLFVGSAKLCIDYIVSAAACSASAVEAAAR